MEQKCIKFLVDGSRRPAKIVVPVTETRHPTRALQGSALAENTASAPHMQSTPLVAGVCSRNPVQNPQSKDPNASSA